MDGFLFGIGILGFLVGLLLTIAEAKCLVSASTQIGNFCGVVGPFFFSYGLRSSGYWCSILIPREIKFKKKLFTKRLLPGVLVVTRLPVFLLSNIS